MPNLLQNLRPLYVPFSISDFMTLRPGDVVFTGTPENGHYPVKVGDVMEVDIEGIGRLTTPVGPKL